MNRCKKIGFVGLLSAAACLPALPVEAVEKPPPPCLALASDQDAKPPKLKPLEPSGMVWDGNSTIYIVSDNGQIVSIPVADPSTTDPTQWNVLYQWVKDKKSGDKDKAANDFESVARVPGQADFLYVGVEGDGGKGCVGCAGSTIKEFSISGEKFTSKEWVLGGTNMEAMTFIPDATVDPTGFKGYFLTAAQNKAGVHRYDLDLNDGKTVKENTAPTFTPKLVSHTADFQFSPGNSVFYVVYDDDTVYDPEKPGNQKVVQYTKSGESFTGGLATNLPYSRGVEAVADVLTGGTVNLYIGIDMSGNQRSTEKAPNRVDLYAPFPEYKACPCAVATSCDLIKGHSDCGWCTSLNRAMAGSEDGGPKPGACANWVWKSSDCNCAAMTKCKDIGDGKKNCGWCGGTVKQAMPGDKNGPSYGTCKDWIWDSNDKNCGN